MATESDLIFSPQANHNFSRILTDLKRANLTITNRLRSIRADAAFVASAASAFGNRPLVANERCGSWYVPPQHKAASAYFKSTDGHAGQWNFSTRRLNLHLLPLISDADGCIIVDSTRRGKAMPDALTKTVPIWCAVLNQLLFPELPASEHALRTPPAVVSRSEHALAEARIPDHVAALRALGIVDVRAARRQLAKPLRPLWVTPESLLLSANGGVVFEDAHPVICCTSSRRVGGAEMSEGGYIQGAGDDTENWARGLTAILFWENVDRLLGMGEAELPGFVRKLVLDAQIAPNAGLNGHGPVVVRVAPCLFVGTLSASAEATCTVMLTPEKKTTDMGAEKTPALMQVGVGRQLKSAGRNLRVALPAICDFVGARLAAGGGGGEAPDGAVGEGGKRILILCETGKDLSIGVALAIACRFFDDDGNNHDNGEGNCYSPRPPDKGVNKNQIKTRLGRMMMAFPEANPSRATLQSVNSYLMG